MLTKVQRMRAVRAEKTYFPRKNRSTYTDSFYIDTVRPDKEPPDLTPRMQRVYAAMMTGPEYTVRDLATRTGLTKSQVESSLGGMAYRHLVRKTTDGLRVWWRLD